MIFKQYINDLRNAQSVINSISNVEVWANGTTGLLNTNSLNSLKTAVSGLSKEQALLVLSSKSLTQVQQEQVLIEAGIIASNDKINASMVQRALAESTLTAEQQKDILTKLELVNIETGEVIATNACTKATLEEALAKKGIVGADAEAIISSIGLTSANAAQTISFDLLTASIWANIKALGKWLVTNPIGWVILGGTAIFGLAKAYDTLTDSTEEVKERTDALLNSYDSAISKANSNAKTIESLASRYETLSKGVNNLGENVSLTADEYSEYNDIVNQIAKMFPTMITGYTDEGNAIIALKGNAEELRDTYKEAQKEAYNLLIVSGEDSDGNDIITNYQNQIHGNESFLSTASTYIDGEAGAKDAIDIITRLTGALTPDEFRAAYNQLYEEYKNIWNSEKIQDALKSSGFEELTHAPKWSELTTEDLASVKYSAQGTIQTYQAEIDSQLQNVRTLANAYLMTNEDYTKLDEQSKTAASLLVNSIDESIADKFENKSDVGAYVGKLINLISNNKKAQKALSDLFTMDTTNMSVGEIQSEVNSYISIIANAIGENSDNLKIRLGFNDLDIQTLINNVKGKLKGTEFDDKVEELSFDDLQIAADLKVADDTIQSWDELIERIEKAKSSTSDDDNIFSTTEILSQVQALSKGLDQINKIYADVYDKEDFDWSSILNNEDFIEAFGDMENVTKEYKDTYEDFIKIVSNSPDNLDACQSAFDNLATTYVYNSGVLNNLSKETKDATIAMLSQMGVENAEEIVTAALTAEKEALALKEQALAITKDGVTDKTIEEINTLLDEANASEATRSYLFKLIAEEQAFDNTDLDVSGKIAELEKLAGAYAGTASAAAMSARLAYMKEQAEKSHIGFNPTLADLKDLQQEINDAVLTPVKVDFGGGSTAKASKDKSSKDSSSDSSTTPSEVTKEFNWIEKYLEAFAKKTEKIMNKVSDYLSFKKNLSTIKSAVKAVQKEISANEKALQNYQEQMNAVGLDSKYIAKIKNGELNIETITGYETNGNKDANAQLIEKIEKYQDLYNKYTSIQDTIEDLRNTEKEWLVKNLEYINEYYQKLSNLKNLAIDKKQDNIDLKEAQGKKVTTGDYNGLISNNEAYINSLRTTYKKTNAEFNKLVKNGTIEKDSTEWFEWTETLADIGSEIIQAQINTEEWKDEIEDLNIQKYTDAVDKLKTKNDELNDVMSEREALGLEVREKDYSSLIKNNDRQIKQLEKQNALLVEYQSQIQKGSERWKEFQNQIDSNNSSIRQLNQNTTELINNIANIPIEKRDYDLETSSDRLALLQKKYDNATSSKERKEILKLMEEEQKKQREINEQAKITTKNNLSTSQNNLLNYKSEQQSKSEKSSADIKENQKYISSKQKELNTLSKQESSLNKKISAIDQKIKNTKDKTLLKELNNQKKDYEEQLNEIQKKKNEVSSQLTTANKNLEKSKAELKEAEKNMSALSGFKEGEKIDTEGIADQETLKWVKEYNLALDACEQAEYDAAIAEEEWTAQMRENAQTHLDIIKEEYESLIDLNNSYSDATNSLINMRKVQGNPIEDSLYEDLIRNSQEDVDLAYEEWQKHSEQMAQNDYSNDPEGYRKALAENNRLQQAWYESVKTAEEYVDTLMDSRIEALEEEKEKLQKLHDLQERRYKLEEAKYNLEKAKQRTNLVYNGTEFVYQADAKSVKDAEKSLEDAEYDELIHKIDDWIDAIEAAKEDINLYDADGKPLTNIDEIIETAKAFGDNLLDGLSKLLESNGYTSGNLSNASSIVAVRDEELIFTKEQGEKLQQKFSGISPVFADSIHLKPTLPAPGNVNAASHIEINMNGDMQFNEVQNVNDLSKAIVNGQLRNSMKRELGKRKI